jgi:hypothetical protein
MRLKVSLPRLTREASLAVACACAVAASASDRSSPPPAVDLRFESQTRGLSTLRMEDGQTVELYEASHALVIGMSKYTNGWRALPGVETDVTAVREVLEAHGFTVRVERDLSREAFDRTLREFISAHGMRPRHRLLLYFAGHGHTQAASDGRQLGFIVPVDAPLPMSDPAGFRSRAISMDQVEVYAREIESRHALMVFDSCFSGTLFDVTRALPGAVASNLEQPVRQFITAGDAGQEVPDRSEFRRQFVAGLKGEADLFADGYISGTELGMFLEQKVASYTRGAQTPRFGKIRDGRLDKGDMIFQSPTWTPESRLSRPSTSMPAASSSRSDDAAHWDAIKSSRDRSAFEEFVQKFPQSQYTTLATRRLDELLREDPVATASRLLAAIRGRDFKTAYSLIAERARQAYPEATVSAALEQTLNRLPLAGGSKVLFEERSPDGSGAMVVFVAGDQFQRVTLVRDGTRWGGWNYVWLPRETAVPSKGPAFRDAAVEFVDLLNAKRPTDAFERLSPALQTYFGGLPKFTETAAAYMAAGRPGSRELVYVEQDSPVSGFVIFRTRFATASTFERVSLVHDSGRWLVVAWMLIPTMP